MLKPRPPGLLHATLSAATFSVAAFSVAAFSAAIVPASPSPVAAGESLPAYKIFVESDGAYQVGFEDLPAAGEPLPSAGLGLTTSGQPVPVWVEDGGDGLFGPGDRVEFLGEHLQGEVSYASEHSRFNVYVLRFDHADPARMTPVAAVPPPPFASFRSCRTRRHLENDELILRLSGRRDKERQELWYWAKMAHSHRQPFSHQLALPDLEPDPELSVGLSIAFRGWSQPARRRGEQDRLPDHAVEVWLNGSRLTVGTWDGTDPHVVSLPEIPADRFVAGDNTLRLAVPARSVAEGADPLIDVVMLNWIEVTYPRAERLLGRQAYCESPGPPAPVRLLVEAGQRPVAYGADGSRIADGAMARPDGEAGAARVFQLPEGVSEWIVSEPARLASPEAIVRDRPSRLADAGNRADYVMIAHSRLIDAIEPLAELHRSRGLMVEVVDVEDVFDEFGHGLVHPEALRSFLAHAYHHWQRPAPRFVLLVGDASWDGKNQVANNANYADWTYRPGETRRFVKNKTTLYEDAADRNHRGLIPTWNYHTYQGHSASDNHFVAVDGDDRLPDLALGRLPVVEPAEVEQIVAKTIRYATSPEVGPWRRSALLITNESNGFQRQSDRLAERLAGEGFVAEKIYPASTEVSNEAHTRQILDTFSRGQLLVHFLGHGGRYIWRTGPPDLKKNHDLFTLDDLDQLEPTGRLPIVLSLTCYSAPFDHPNADSIGEKLLRIADRGAVAVFAASWRNSPSANWGRALFEALTTPGATVGEAIVSAKREVRSPMFVETYNLLGDPALPVALPAGEIELEATWAEGRWQVRGTGDPEVLAGEVLIDVLGAGGEVMKTVSVEAGASELDFEIGLPEARVVRAYAWNTELGRDAVGAVQLPDPPVSASAATAETARSEP